MDRNGKTRTRGRFPKARDTREGARLVILGLGSNDDAASSIPKAIDELSYAFDLLVKSTRYVGPPERDLAPEIDAETATKSGTADADSATEEVLYSNAAVLVRTADSYREMRDRIKEIEDDLGRDRSKPGIVSIDIDILLIQDEVVRTSDDRVIVPHPDLTTRRHAAIPSSEVAPSLRHPRTKERIAEIAARLA